MNGAAVDAGEIVAPAAPGAGFPRPTQRGRLGGRDDCCRHQAVFGMKRRQVLVMATMAIAQFLPTRSIACFGNSQAAPTTSTRWIVLKTTMQHPHFYYVSNNMSVFLPTEFLANHQHPIAAEILSVAPLNDHTDIHRGLILGEHDLFDVQYVVADALEAGVAVVYSIRRRKFVSQVKRVTLSQDCSSSRRFYISDDSGEDLIIGTLDSVS